jgi:hypothetical protein
MTDASLAKAFGVLFEAPWMGHRDLVVLMVFWGIFKVLSECVHGSDVGDPRGVAGTRLEEVIVFGVCTVHYGKRLSMCYCVCTIGVWDTVLNASAMFLDRRRPSVSS